MSESTKGPERIGVVAIATALGKNRKIVQRWKGRGAPFGEDGLAVLAEIVEWARKTGHLDRVKGRPDDLARLMAAVDRSGDAADAAAARARLDAQSRPTASAEAEAAASVTSELSAADREAIQALIDGDATKLIDLANRVSATVLKKLAFMGMTRLKLADAQRRELENQARKRQLVEIEEVRRFWSGQIGIVKAHFMALPGKLAGALAKQEYETVYRVLEDELHALLERFAVEVPT